MTYFSLYWFSEVDMQMGARENPVGWFAVTKQKKYLFFPESKMHSWEASLLVQSSHYK